MKYILISVAFLYCTCFAHSQNNFEYVEVIVEDSLQIEAEEFFYTIQEVNYAYSEAVGFKTNKSTHNKITPLNQIRKIINELSIDTIGDEGFGFTTVYNHEERAEVIHLKFTSQEKLVEFQRRAKEIKNLSGILTHTQSSKSELARKKLIQKLISKAKEEANYIAEQSKKTLGKIMIIKDADSQVESAEGEWASYPPLSVIPGWVTSISQQTQGKVILIKKMLIRFAWQ